MTDRNDTGQLSTRGVATVVWESYGSGRYPLAHFSSLNW